MQWHPSSSVNNQEQWYVLAMRSSMFISCIMYIDSIVLSNYTTSLFRFTLPRKVDCITVRCHSYVATNNGAVLDIFTFIANSIDTWYMWIMENQWVSSSGSPAFRLHPLEIFLPLVLWLYWWWLTFFLCCCSVCLWFLTCFRSELGSVYRFVQPGTWQAYGF